MKILIISNGHGEDLVGAALAKKLEPAAKSRGSIKALPLVGEGKAYQCPVLGPRKKLPGGGFSFRNLKYLWPDIKNGLLGQTFEFIKILRSQKPDLVIAIGDIVPIIAAKLAKAPFIFVGVNKTEYYRFFGYSYTPWEINLLKKAKRVFARDIHTSLKLKAKGINATFAGNPLMDVLRPLSAVRRPSRTIGLLPGTRAKDVELNLKDFEEITREIKKFDPEINFIIAKDRPFKEVLEKSKITIGLSGTGNEQAAGCGIPVIAFPGQGSQYNKKFGLAQKQLLGDALEFIAERDFKKIAGRAVEILNNPALREKMAKSGIRRMGGDGAIDIIIQKILNEKI